MFHRRLLLLAVVGVVVAVALGAAATRMTTGQAHLDATESATRKLRRFDLAPTQRGRILDRHGRVLAEDRPGWDVVVHYSLIEGSWPARHARAAARRAAGTAWGSLDADGRAALIREHTQRLDDQTEMVWVLLAEAGQMAREHVEQRKTDVVRLVQYRQNVMWLRWQRDLERRLGRTVPLERAMRPIGEETDHYAVLRDIDENTRHVVQEILVRAQDEQAAYLDQPRADPDRRELRPWGLVKLRRPTQRRYPLETMTVMLDRSTLPPVAGLRVDAQEQITVAGVGLHILGQMRPVRAEDVTGPSGRPLHVLDDQHRWQTDLRGYDPNDPQERVGRFGIEKAMERRLRGTRGRVTRRRDTGDRQALSAVPGQDIHLTLDIKLQARVQAILSPQFGLMRVNPWHDTKAAKALSPGNPGTPGTQGPPLNGAAIVLDVATGEVLAAVSNPAMSMDALRNDPDSVYRDPWNLPYLNRCVGAMYQPGSTLKPLVLAAAATAGKYDLSQPMLCDGIFDHDHPTRHRCWIYRMTLAGHGLLTASRSLTVSCNDVYYQLGHRLGVAGLVDWMGRFGLGRPVGCGLDEEIGAVLPDPNRVGASESINMGIGQGPIAWTPIQAASAYAALARGGVVIPPTFIAAPSRTEPRGSIDLHLDPAAIDAALDGLHGVVYGSQGTGRVLHRLPGKPEIFNLPGVVVYGKSGTAQTGKVRWVDANADGQRQSQEVHPDPEAHGWFIAMVQPDGADRPTHVVVVVCEYAGSGAATSGPIVNQILHAMRTEGYLPS